MVTFEPITTEDRNLCEFQTMPSGQWHAAKMSCEVVEMMRTSQFNQYMERVKKSTCEAEMRRLMASGPPLWIEDKFGLPLLEGDTHVENLWYASDEQERSAKLEGAPEGEERDALWASLQAFQTEGGDEEGGEGGEGDQGADANGEGAQQSSQQETSGTTEG